MLVQQHEGLLFLLGRYALVPTFKHCVCSCSLKGLTKHLPTMCATVALTDSEWVISLCVCVCVTERTCHVMHKDSLCCSIWWNKTPALFGEHNISICIQAPSELLESE